MPSYRYTYPIARQLAIALFYLLIPIPLLADEADDCAQLSGDARIAACTRTIESGRWQGAKLSLAYSNRGAAKQERGDFDGALADYKRALELDPRNASAYNNRGNVKQLQGDLDGAMADYDRALALDPHDALAHSNRGLARRAKGDLDGAIADLNRALELDARNATAVNNRGLAKQAKGDLDGAVADHNRALALDPQDVIALISRGLAYYFKNDFMTAATDFARAQQLYPDAYASLWLYLARSRAGGDAKSELAANAAKLDAAKWPAPLVALYLGKITPAVVLKDAEHPDTKTRKERLCEANFYLGNWHELAGNRAQAASLLRLARDRCATDSVESTAAIFALKRLGAAK